MYLKALLLLSFAIFASGIPLQGRIVNGTDAKPGDVPFIISLRNLNRHNCGGSILSSGFVVTAAHCVYNYLPSWLSVQYGLIDIIQEANAPNVIQVEQIFVHPNYTVGGGYLFDVAVLKLQSPILFNANVQPVQLPAAYNATPENSEALLSGWGYLYSGGSVVVTLQKVNIFVYSDEDCERIHAITGPTNRFNHVCAGVPEGGKGQCSGDSGGPLVVDNKLVGLVSWSVKPCTVKGYPGVFTKVSNVVVWILEQLQK